MSAKTGVRWTREQYAEYLRKTGQNPDSSVPSPVPQLPTEDKKPVRSVRGPNKTEAAFGRILTIRISNGEFTRIEYEGLTLKWCGMRYTPDWVAFKADGGIVCFEIKGPHIWSRDLVRFKGARHQWPEFDFQMWQLEKGDWRRIA